ncbi:MAG: S8 family serine peptidase [Candidatus Eisenbacteria bacterium]
MKRFFPPIAGDRSTRIATLVTILALATVPVGCGKNAPTGPTSRSAAPLDAGALARKPVSVDSRVVVSLAPTADVFTIAADHSAKVVTELGFGLAVLQPIGNQDPVRLVAELERDAGVVAAEIDGLFETPEGRQVSVAFDDGDGTPEEISTQPAGLTVGFAAAHAVSRGAGIRIAILDTGASGTHPVLAGRIADGWDFVGGDPDPSEEANGKDDDRDGFIDESAGHGTHVAGIIATGAPDAQLLIARVLDADGRGDFANVAAGVRWALDRGARVINLSLGGVRGSNIVQDALEAAESTGVVCVSSAGNWGSDKPEEFPAKSSHVAAVAAVDAGNAPASFSSFAGYVAVSAPGVAIRSSYLDGRYASWSGTSMAAPFVSATAALLVSIHPNWDLRLVMMRIGNTASPVVTSDAVLAEKFGAGVLDAAAALAPDAP